MTPPPLQTITARSVLDVILDQWHVTAGVLAFIAVLSFLFRLSQKNVLRDARVLLDGGLAPFTGVPPERLEAELTTAFLASQRGWPFALGLANSLVGAALVLLLFKLVGAFGASSPLALPFLILVLISLLGLTTWIDRCVRRMQQREMLRRLEPLLQQPAD